MAAILVLMHFENTSSRVLVPCAVVALLWGPLQHVAGLCLLKCGLAGDGKAAAAGLFLLDAIVTGAVSPLWSWALAPTAFGLTCVTLNSLVTGGLSRFSRAAILTVAAAVISRLVLGPMPHLASGTAVAVLGTAAVIGYSAFVGLLTNRFVTALSAARKRLHANATRLEAIATQQREVVEAASRIARGDLGTPVEVDATSELSHVTGGLEAMRIEIRAKFTELERRNAEVQGLNRQLRRQIMERSRGFLASVLEREGEPGGRPESVAVGDRIAGAYTIVRRIGAGGMGTVFEVERDVDHTRFAAKLHQAGDDPHAMARFAREAEILASIEHPNLVSVVDVDFGQRGLMWIVMEYVEGEPLGNRLGTRHDPTFVRTVLLQIGRALAAVHERGIIHRDLKPSNILLRADGTGGPLVKLADFGIAWLGSPGGHPSHRPPNPATIPSTPHEKAGLDPLDPTLPGSGEPQQREVAAPSGPADASQWPKLTRTGAMVGTPLYMAPEMFLDSSKPTPAADVFSLGVIACELVSGVHPFGVPSCLLTDNARDERLRKALGGAGDLGPDVAEVIQTCLSMDPVARPTASAICERLEPQ